MTGDIDSQQTSRKRRSVTLLALTCLVALIGITGMLVVRTGNPTVSSEWPRPYDPAKPFNMLGVPGVSVEQRKRAEDLLVRSLQEAPRWSDYQGLLKSGWYSHSLSLPNPDSLIFEHLIRPEYFADGRMLDPEYPESLVYKVKNGKRTFVAYMYIAEPDITLDDPRIAGFAGRLIEWHDHSDVCWQHDDEQIVGGVAGFKLPDGSCPVADTDDVGVDPKYFTGEAEKDSLVDFGSVLMTHVWVVQRLCGPFSALEGRARGTSTTPLDERVDVCLR